MEELYAEFLLWLNKLRTSERYELLLHKYFTNNPSDKIFLELEECSSDILRTNIIFNNYWSLESNVLNVDEFGKQLFIRLEDIYKSNKFAIDKFGELCCLLWKCLPASVNQQEPFWTLSYADECLSWNDETQTRQLYEKSFEFYKK